MKNELKIRAILAGVLFLNSCAPIVAKAVSPDTATPDPDKTFYDPNLATKIPTITPRPTSTPLPTEIAKPMANECISPFDGSLMEGGLQFLSVITNNGEAEIDENTGNIRRHLGLDFKGGDPGDPVLNMCDGTLIFSGHVKEGWGNNLGNIVVIKYDYLENGETKTVYARYAHMENVTDAAPGTIISKGTKIGHLGNSGGWDVEKWHLHVDMMTAEGFEYFVINRPAALKDVIGEYAALEGMGEEKIKKFFIDPKPWLLARLSR